MDDALLGDALNGDFWAQEEGWNPALKAELVPDKEHDHSEAATGTAPDIAGIEAPISKEADDHFMTPLTGFITAKVVLAVKYRYDDHITRLKASDGRLRNLDKTEAMTCLIALLDDPEVRAKWAAVAESRRG